MVTPSRRDVVEIDGTRWLVAVAPTTVFDGAVVVQQSEDEALAPVRGQLSLLVLVIVAVIAAAVISVVLAGRHLLRPLGPLSEAVERLGRGEQGVRTDVHGRGEIGTLAWSFNRMAERLDRRREELAEMHHLSLLVWSHAEHGDVAGQIVEGARALFAARGAAFLSITDGDGLRIDAAAGELGEAASVEQAATHAVDGKSPGPAFTGTDGEVLLAFPVTSVDGTDVGVLVIVDGGREVDEEQLRLAETFASFAAVALEGVRRLELEQALVHELQQAVDHRRELLRNVTHDLRIPVTVIGSFSSRLREGWEEMGAEERDQLLDEIAEHARELDAVVSEVLEFTVSERGRRRIEVAPVSLRRAADAAVAALEPLAGQRPIESDVPDLDVMADPVLLSRAITHLLSNAVRSSPPGTPISVRGSVEGDVARVAVFDQGPALSSGELTRAFEPFWRRSGVDGEPAGSSLGLALAAEYVRSMGGSVDAAAVPGRGTSFSISLPAVPRDR